MGRFVYLPTWMVDFYGKLVGKYTFRPMDPMGIGFHGIDVIHLKLPQWPSEFASTFIKVWPNPTHTIHVWYIYLHEWLIFMANVGKYTSPMDCLGYTSKHLFEEVFEPPNISWGSALRVPNTEPHQVWLEDFGCLESNRERIWANYNISPTFIFLK